MLFSFLALSHHRWTPCDSFVDEKELRENFIDWWMDSFRLAIAGSDIAERRLHCWARDQTSRIRSLVASSQLSLEISQSAIFWSFGQYLIVVIDEMDETVRYDAKQHQIQLMLRLRLTFIRAERFNQSAITGMSNAFCREETGFNRFRLEDSIQNRVLWWLWLIDSPGSVGNAQQQITCWNVKYPAFSPLLRKTRSQDLQHWRLACRDSFKSRWLPVRCFFVARGSHKLRS